jgi:hypothetical protein
MYVATYVCNMYVCMYVGFVDFRISGAQLFSVSRIF